MYSYLDCLHDELKTILSVFSDVCKKANVKFYLAYGSLLGAARHKDIIPWDDDIDVQMFRDDYDKLISFLGESESLTYSLITPKTDKTYTQMFGKFVQNGTKQDLKEYCTLESGLSIDVFPLDYFSNPKSIRFKLKRRFILYLQSVINSKYSLHHKKEPFLKRLLRIVFCLPFCFFDENRIARLIDKMARNPKKANYVINYGGISAREQCPLHVDDFMGSVNLLFFGNSQYLVPCNYDKMLSNIYGEDWWMIPDENKRIQHKKYDN